MQNSDIRFISSKDQIADVFTKPLSSSQFSFLCNKLNVDPLPLSLRGRVIELSPYNSPNVILDSNTIFAFISSTEDKLKSTTNHDKDRQLFRHIYLICNLNLYFVIFSYLM
jgi:hypothetical protein